MPHVFVLGGPNGAGKSTTARLLLPDYLGIHEFVNADDIARGLCAFAPDSVAFEAGRIMLQRLRQLAERRVSFAFETTLATRSFAPWLQELQADRGYAVHVLYLWIASPRLALDRVEKRVRAGGHHIPAPVLRRRYERGRFNFLNLYRPLADNWAVYDNSHSSPRTVAYGGRHEPACILDPATWREIEEVEE